MVMQRFLSGFLVVSSLCSGSSDPEMLKWREVVDAMVAESPADSKAVCVSAVDSSETLAALREAKPRYVAFVIRPDELNAKVVRRLKRIICEVDSDPFEDAVWGIVTGPTPEDAKRVATSFEPRDISSVLATTGLGADAVPGPVTVLSDANPPGEWWAKDASGKVERHTTAGDTSHIFREAWEKTDPEFLLTSSHASERNLEMPFSRGNIVAYRGKFGAVKNLRMIDYSTGQAVERKVDALKVDLLAAPKREKVWLAAGNCLIANHKPGDDMIMTALGFGKVNQFVGYIKTTWYGEIGWNTWRYFGSYGYSLVESWHAANQFLIKKLRVDKTEKTPRDRAGLSWDFDATVFYGNPRRRIRLPHPGRLEASKVGDLPLIIIFPDAENGRRLLSGPEGFEVFVADDFALVTKWPRLTDDWQSKLKFSGSASCAAN